MKLIAVALLLALFSASLGAINSFSELSGDSWIIGQTDPTLPQTDWEVVVQDMDNENRTGFIDDVLSYMRVAILIGKMLLSALSGVLFIGLTINSMFYYEVNGINVVSYISIVINVGVWLIYIIGLYQIKHGDSIRHYW
ncbi:MAG: hypothetical protein FWE54_01710 [Methanimicrococcus sp.]|nr:hypothetical protein [Methanimicrococcus sp.]